MALACAILLPAGTLTAQAPSAASRDTACTYGSCALTIVPAWNGLAVARGVNGDRVALLHFFLPRDVSRDIAGPDSVMVGAERAREEGYHAVQLRRSAAALTDGGALLLAVAGIRAIRAGHARPQDAALAGLGGAAFAVSVPLQFAADGALSRAIWWYNRRFAP